MREPTRHPSEPIDPPDAWGERIAPSLPPERSLRNLQPAPSKRDARAALFYEPGMRRFWTIPVKAGERGCGGGFSFGLSGCFS